MDAYIAVASHSLGAGFPGLIYSHIRRQVRAGQSIRECAIVLREDPEFMRSRLLRLLETEPRPIALICICLRPDAATVEQFQAVGAPVILIDEEAENCSTVAFDNFAGGQLAAQHLLETGRQSIAVVAGQLNTNGSYNAIQRVKGVQRAFAHRGLALSMEDVVQVANYSRQDGVAALAKLIGHGRNLDAVFCAAGDMCATGLLAAARERHIRVPDQLAILGYDDNPLASISNPPLSTIRQPLEEIAAHAWRLSSENPVELLARPERVLLKPTVVQRSTT
jgi:LacI family transcriptional regulator